jgi:hypothetical protein
VGAITTSGTSSEYQWQRGNSGTLGSPGGSAPSYDKLIVTNGPGTNLSGIQFKPLTTNASGVDAPLPLVNSEAGGDSFAYDQVKGLGRYYTGVVSTTPGPGNALAAAPVYEEHTAVIKVRLVSVPNGGGSSVDLVIDRESYAKFADSPNAAAFCSLPQ